MSDYIIYNGELYHYGVKGMKWGRRRAARKTYKNAKNKAFSKYEREINDIEKGYKRGQMLSKNDQAREARAESNYKKAVAKAKSDYKQAKKEYKQSDEYKQQADARKAAAKKVAKGVAVAAAVLGTAYASKKVSDVVKDKKAAKGRAMAEAAMRKRNMVVNNSYERAKAALSGPNPAISGKIGDQYGYYEIFRDGATTGLRRHNY